MYIHILLISEPSIWNTMLFFLNLTTTYVYYLLNIPYVWSFFCPSSLSFKWNLSSSKHIYYLRNSNPLCVFFSPELRCQGNICSCFLRSYLDSIVLWTLAYAPWDGGVAACWMANTFSSPQWWSKIWKKWMRPTQKNLYRNCWTKHEIWRFLENVIAYCTIYPYFRELWLILTYKMRGLKSERENSGHYSNYYNKFVLSQKPHKKLVKIFINSNTHPSIKNNQ